MTYRERFVQLFGEKGADIVHMHFCPDQMQGILSAGQFSSCPHPTDHCRGCWDREIPGTEVPNDTKA